MNRIILLLCFLCSYSGFGQSVSVFNVDTSNFPLMKAKFFAFDQSGERLANFKISDFTISENGKTKPVTYISCPGNKPSEPISSVLVMDISVSMAGNGLTIAKAAANAWIDMLPLGKSECAISSFSDLSYINKDFTTNKSILTACINNLKSVEGTNYDAALLDVNAGAINLAKAGRHKKIIVFLTDGAPNNEPNTDEIIAQAKAGNIAIYGVTVNMLATYSMKRFIAETGGLCFENITTKEQAEECYRRILATVQDDIPCELEWKSSYTCEAVSKINLEVNVAGITNPAKTVYAAPQSSYGTLEVFPKSFKLLYINPNEKFDTTVTISSRSGVFNVQNIKCTNPAFNVQPASFSLAPGESKVVKLSFVAPDSGYNYCAFTIETDVCPAYFSAGGGFPGKKPKSTTLKLIQPNSGEVFVAGMDTTITWEGVLPEDKVVIEYSTDNGATWNLITNKAVGLSYKWKIPKTPSGSCLARVTTKTVGIPSNCTADDIVVGKKVWMGCNLDIDTYRNGDPIPEVKDPKEWANLTTGAWCYYNNDIKTGGTYGKLYNWYAINDPRGFGPTGWHVATDAEWAVFGTNGGALKETGTQHWLAPNSWATDTYGFTALPGGWRIQNGAFNFLGDTGAWWTATEANPTTAKAKIIYYNNGTLNNFNYSKNDGFSVRCVKD